MDDSFAIKVREGLQDRLENELGLLYREPETIKLEDLASF